MNANTPRKNEETDKEKRSTREGFLRDRDAVVGMLNLSDEEILNIIRNKTKELGRVPKKVEVPGSYYIRQRFGAWHRVLEAAGVREVTPARMARQKAKREKRKNGRRTR